MGDYQFICMPLMGVISGETAEALLAYVERGGVLIGFARCGTLDGRGWYHPELPITELGKVFGEAEVKTRKAIMRKYNLTERQLNKILQKNT